MAVNYVKFFRGTPLAFENAIKNSDTLYFITETDSQKGALYLGEKLIASSVSSVADFEDVLLTELANNQVLVYSEESDKWINKSFIDAIGIMVGATEEDQGSNGLVPAPPAKAQEMFLRGDGTWAIPTVENNFLVDNKTIEFINEDALSLKDFEKQYYRYTDGEYKLQPVNSEYPWIEGLEPKVVKSNNEFTIGWFEPNTTTLEGVQDSITILNSTINNLDSQVSILNTAISNVFTKTETKNLITQEIGKINHLTREICQDFDHALEKAASKENPENYIYMIPSNKDGNNKYEEYLWIDGILEKVGSWDVDLSNYATKEDIVKLDTIEVGAQKNFINSIDSSQMQVDLDGKLSIVEISKSIIKDFEEISIPFDKVSNDFIIAEDKTLTLSKTFLDSSIYYSEVGDLSLLNRQIENKNEKQSTIVDEINNINDRLQWQELN